MRRPFVILNFALAAALAPALCFAQAAPAQPSAQQPATRQPATQDTAPAAPGTPTTPKLAFTTPAGLLLVQIKPDQTSVFEEMMGKLKTGLASTPDPTRTQTA